MTNNPSALPPGWTWASVEELGETGEQPVLTGPFGTNLTKNDFVSSGIPVLTIGCLTDHGLDLNKAMFVSEKTAQDLDRYHLRKGDFLFSRMASVGRASIVPESLQGALFNYHIMRLRLSRRVYEPSLFLAHVKGAPSTKAYLESVNHGGTRDGINTAQLLKMPIAVPPIAEQRRIVSKLESLMARSRRAKEALDAIPALLERFRQSVLASAFRGDLTADWRAQHPGVEPASKLLERIRAERRRRWEEAELEKMRAKGKAPKNDAWKSKYEEPQVIDTSGLPQLPQGWCWASADCCAWEITVGHVGPMKEQYVPSGVPFLRSQNVRENKFDERELRYIPQAFHETIAKSALRPGDLVIVRSGAPGTACVIPPDLTEANCSDLVIVRLVKSLNPNLISYFINSNTARNRIIGLQVGVAQQHFNIGAMRGLPIPVMPEDEQHLLRQRLQQHFTSLEKIEESALSSEKKQVELERALLAKAFRGELVPQDPNDEPASVLLERIRAEREATAGSASKRPRGRRPAA